MHVLVIGRGVPDKQYPMNGVFEFDQARALANNGLQVTFFAIDLRSFRRKRKFGVNSGIQDKVKWYSVDIPIGAVSPIIRRKITTWALEKLYRKVFSESDSDIIHAHFYGPAFSAAKLAEKVHIPLVVTEHCSTMNNSRVSCDILKTASFGAVKKRRGKTRRDYTAPFSCLEAEEKWKKGRTAPTPQEMACGKLKLPCGAGSVY